MERTTIAQHIQQLTHCGQRESSQLAELFLPHPLKPREHLQLKRDYSRSIFFLYSGLLHISQSHYKKDTTPPKTENSTLAIYQPNEFFFLPPTQTEPSLNVRAIGDSQLYIADYPRIEQLIHQKTTLIRPYISLGEQYLKQTLEHLQLLQLPTAHQKYQIMQKHFGKRLYLIPYQYQASYIGISRKHLSRIT